MIFKSIYYYNIPYFNLSNLLLLEKWGFLHLEIPFFVSRKCRNTFWGHCMFLYLFPHLTGCNMPSNLTLLRGGRARTLAVIGPFLCCVLHVLWTGVCRCHPLLVAIVTLGRLGSQALRLAQLESDLPVLFLYLSNPWCQDIPFQQPCFCRFHQACGEEQGTPVWYGTTDFISFEWSWQITPQRWMRGKEIGSLRWTCRETIYVNVIQI